MGNFIEGMKKAFEPNNNRREEKNQRAYTISATEVQQKLGLKGKIIWINFNKEKGIVKITTEE